MNALLVIGELIGLDAIGFHVLGIGVTMRTGGRNVRWMYRGTGVGRRTQVMHAMTIGAHCNLGVAPGPLDAMHAGLVLLELINPQPGVVLLHLLCVGMTGRAQLRNLLALDFAFPSR